MFCIIKNYQDGYKNNSEISVFFEKIINAIDNKIKENGPVFWQGNIVMLLQFKEELVASGIPEYLSELTCFLLIDKNYSCDKLRENLEIFEKIHLDIEKNLDPKKWGLKDENNKIIDQYDLTDDDHKILLTQDIVKLIGKIFPGKDIYDDRKVGFNSYSISFALNAFYSGIGLGQCFPISILTNSVLKSFGLNANIYLTYVNSKGIYSKHAKTIIDLDSGGVVSKQIIFPEFNQYQEELKKVFNDTSSENLKFKSDLTISQIEEILPKDIPQELLNILRYFHGGNYVCDRVTYFSTTGQFNTQKGILDDSNYSEHLAKVSYFNDTLADILYHYYVEELSDKAALQENCLIDLFNNGQQDNLFLLKGLFKLYYEYGLYFKANKLVGGMIWQLYLDNPVLIDFSMDLLPSLIDNLTKEISVVDDQERKKEIRKFIKEIVSNKEVKKRFVIKFKNGNYKLIAKHE